MGFQRADGPLAGCQGGALTEFHKDELRIFVNYSCGALPHTPQKAEGLLKPNQTGSKTSSAVADDALGNSGALGKSGQPDGGQQEAAISLRG